MSFRPYFVFIWILLFSANMLFAQTIEIETVRTENYPTMRGEFRVKNAANVEVRNFDINELELNENGVPVDIEEIFCSPDASRLSIVLTVDVSGSMNLGIDSEENTQPTRLNVIKNVLKNFVDRLDPENSEVALTKFSARSNIISEFTQDYDELKTDINNLTLGTPTNYNAAFLGPNDGEGALDVIESARWKPVIIFLSDGEHGENYPAIRSNEITARANQTGTIIYNINIGPNSNNSKAEMEQITGATGGQFYDRLVSEQEVDDIYQQILDAAKGFGDPAPCYLEWITNCDGGEIELTYNVFDPSISVQHSYNIPNSVKPRIEATDRAAFLLNPNLNQTSQIDVIIEAENNDLTITGYSSDKAEFTINNGDWGGTNPPFTIPRGETRTVRVSVTPTNRVLSEANITFEGSACSGRIITPAVGFLFAQDIDFGVVDQGVRDTRTFNQRFCNYTKDEVIIQDVSITGGPNLGDFGFIPQPPRTVAPGDCIELEAYFEPSQDGDREATFTVRTNRGNYEARIYGGGSGNPEIAASIDDFNILNCTNPEQELIVTVTNDGPVPLEINAVTLDNTIDFTYLGPATLSVPANSTNSVDLVVRFNPQNAGLKNGNITIESNAVTGDLTIPISGERIEIDYSTSESTLDFGELCGNIGNPLILTLDLDNDNNFAYTVNASTSSNEFTVNPTFNLDASGSVQVSVSFESGARGDYNETLTFVSECDNIIRTVTLRGKIINPKVEENDLSIVAIVGSTENANFVIRNSTDDQIVVDNAFIVDLVGNPLLELEVTPNSFIIPASGQISVQVSYTPNASNPVDLSGKLILQISQPCEVELDNLEIEATPGIAIADLEISDISAYAGSDISVPVSLIPGAGFNQSNTTEINFELRFRDDLLTSNDGTFVRNEGDLVVYQYSLPVPLGLNNTQNYNLSFSVKTGSSFNQSNLEIITRRAENISGDISAQLNIDNGIFQLLRANAEIVLDPYAAAPGEQIDVRLSVQDDDNSLNEILHSQLRVRLTYNFTVLEPLGFTPVIVDNENAYIDITDQLKFNQIQKINGVQTGLIPFSDIPMRARLGNREVSDIRVTTVDILSGGEADITLNQNTFTLLNICKEGDKLRLYNPTATPAGISYTASANNFDFEIKTAEVGYHKLELYDINGNKVLNVFEMNVNHTGIYFENHDLSRLSNGLYLLVFTTPTQLITKNIGIAK